MTKSKGGYKIKENGKKDTGRPTVMTTETIDKLERCFSLGASDTEACGFADISPTALYEYQRTHPEFAQRKQMLKEKLLLKARTVVANALNNNDESMAKWYLERRAKSEFGTRTEITGADGGAIEYSAKIDVEKVKELKEMLGD